MTSNPFFYIVVVPEKSLAPTATIRGLRIKSFIYIMLNYSDLNDTVCYQCALSLPVLAVLPTDTLLSAPLLVSTAASRYSAFSGSGIHVVSSSSVPHEMSYISQLVTLVAVDMDTFDKVL